MADGPRDAGHAARHGAGAFNGDGEAKAALVQDFTARMDVDLAKKREVRADLARLARPQEGVDVLAGQLPRTGQPEGVRDKAAAR